MISDSDINKVRDATDIVALMGERTQIKQRGRDFWCCCPFHEEKTPSCKIDPATGLWHCFGCGEGGDVFSFIMKSDNMSFVEAVLYLAGRANVDVEQSGGKNHVSMNKKSRLMEVCAEAANFYHTQLMRLTTPNADAARSYLAGRGFGGEVPAKWNLGFAPGSGALVHHLMGKGFTAQEMVDANVAVTGQSGRANDRFYNRIMFPIYDVSGQCIAFGGRVIGDGNPKYLNSQETPIFHKSQVLFGLDKAKAAMTLSGCAIVVEGYTDVIALHEASITNAVATLGTALTMKHIRVLSRHASKKIVYLFDGDAAGQRAADRALQFIDYSMTPEAGASKIELCAVTLPDNLDPAEFVARDGADALRALVDSALPLLQYGIDRRLGAHDLSSAEGRSRALEDAISVLAPIKDSILAKEYAVQIAGRVRVREADALARLASLKAPVQGAQRTEAQGGGGAGAAHSLNKVAQRMRTSISAEEKSRLATEREFLSIVAQNPSGAFSYLDEMAQIKWHEQVHAQISESILQTLVENFSAQPAEIITNASRVTPHAASVLTSAAEHPDSTPEQVIHYLYTDLEIGDCEDEVAAIKAKLANSQSMAAEESQAEFARLVTFQNKISTLKAGRRQI